MQASPSHPRGTTAQIVLAIIGIVLYGLAALIFLFSTFSTGAGSTPALSDKVTTLSLAFTAVTVCILMVPSLVHAIRPPRPAVVASINRSLLILSALGMLLWLGVVGLDDWLIRNSSLPLLPSFLQVLAVGLPLWFIFTFASRGLSVGSAQRKWGIFDFSLTVTPLTITVLEFLLLLFFGLIIVVALLLQPGSLNNLPSFSQVFQNLNNNPSSSDQLISQFAQQPGMLAGILIMIGLLIPLLEEILKPLGLIVLAGRKPTPSQGFVAGMLCGVAFAFLESSGALAGAAGTEWTTLALTRMGTGLLHITASGLMGWGLASAITLKKKGRFWLAYLCAAGLHGVWNTFAVLMGFFPVLTSDLKPNFKVAAWLGNLAPFVLIAMTVGLVMILVFMNRSIRRQANTPPPLLVPPAANPPPIPPG